MPALKCEDATLASRVFQMLSDGELRKAADFIEDELARRVGADHRITAIIQLYNETGLPKVEKLTSPRVRALRQRLREHSESSWWVEFFRRVSQSDFLMGRTKSRDWNATFDWLMKPANMQKVIEGNYDPKGGETRQRLDANDEAAFRMSGVR